MSYCISCTVCLRPIDGFMGDMSYYVLKCDACLLSANTMPDDYLQGTDGDL